LLSESLNDATTLLTLNRPEKRNAMSIELLTALCEQFDLLAADAARRVVILCGAGPVFCAGLDLREAADAKLAEQSAELVARTFRTICESPLVTIAAAHKSAMAGGAGLLCCCDFAIASDDLQIGFPEVRRGLIPALVAAVLSNRLPANVLRELLLIGQPITAERALQWGLVRQIVSANQLLDAALGLGRELLLGAPEAVRRTKRLLSELSDQPLSERLSKALQHHLLARSSAEAAEGISAFLEHRVPEWTQSSEP
jgi:methylglutaconyl-CoA hydratase